MKKYDIEFKKTLETNGSVAQATLLSVLCEGGYDAREAEVLVMSNPGEDLAGIKDYVVAGLSSLAESIGIKPEDFINESRLKYLSTVLPDEIVRAIDAIHRQWVEDNFTPKCFAENFFNKQLFKYRNTENISWEEAEKHLVYIFPYIIIGGGFCGEEVEIAFQKYSKNNSSDEDLEAIEAKVRSFENDIVDAINAYRVKLDPIKESDKIAEIQKFLKEHSDAKEIIDIMIAAITA